MNLPDGERAHKVKRWQIRTKEEAALFLAKKARNAFKASGNSAILLVGPVDGFSAAIRQDLADHGMQPHWVDLAGLGPLAAQGRANFAAVICSYTDIRHSNAVARIVLRHGALRSLPFEQVTFPAGDYATLQRHNRHHALDLVSPLPNYDVDVFGIYEEALAHFEPKCDVRDYMDLCQLVQSIVDNRTPGDVAEFGSFRGHSGYLLASLLQAWDAQRTLYLFDTFDRFPQEDVGVDRFWSGSHAVDFETVQRKFDGFPFVHLVKGDFTDTWPRAGIEHLALVYVDCDSFRATDYLLRQIFAAVLSPGGVMIFEDYGHAPLLGNRAAVDGFFEGRRGCVRFFSHFSGSYIVIKL